MTSGALTSMTLKSSIHMCQTHYTQEGGLGCALGDCARTWGGEGRTVHR